MRALWLVNQLWVIVPVNPRKNPASSELLLRMLVEHLKNSYTTLLAVAEARVISTQFSTNNMISELSMRGFIFDIV